MLFGRAMGFRIMPQLTVYPLQSTFLDRRVLFYHIIRRIFLIADLRRFFPGLYFYIVLFFQ